jgi:hypothetical protein
MYCSVENHVSELPMFCNDAFRASFFQMIFIIFRIEKRSGFGRALLRPSIAVSMGQSFPTQLQLNRRAFWSGRNSQTLVTPFPNSPHGKGSDSNCLS